MLGFCLISTLAVTVLAINQRCDTSVMEDKTFSLTESCPINSHCLENRYCACDKGFIGSCTQKAFAMESGVEITTNLTDSSYTFF